VQDLPELLQLSGAAGWNQTAEDWKMLLDIEPEACFGVEHDGRVVASTTLLCYGRRLAWIGMVLTHPEFRHRGFARRLITRALERARNRHIVTLKLDATTAGRPVYENFGFRSEQPIERWIRAGGAEHSPMSTGSTSYFIAMDAQAYGYDRSTLIRRLAERSYVLAASSAYVFCRAGRVNTYLGPCIAQTASNARRIIEKALETDPNAGWYWDLLPQNENATRIATEFGFTRDRLLTRMVLGPDLRGREEWIYAIAGFELG
jgi:GNAT superfamily N-acetyltransferase